MSITKMTDLHLRDQRLLIREDFNVPLNEKGEITSLARIDAALPTLEFALNAGAKVMVVSHLGRPDEGQFEPKYSLKPVADMLAKLLKRPVRLEREWLNGVEVNAGELVLCENVRFCSGESSNAPELSKQMASLCDIFVMDAFGVSHRKQASTYGVAEYAPVVCAGPLLVAELEALGRALQEPVAPVLAIVGGSKISSKLTLLHSLAQIADTVIVGGGIANTLLAAQGISIGKSLFEANLLEEAKALLAVKGAKEKFPLPVDVVVATEFSASAQAIIKPVEQVMANEMILDIGPKTRELFAQRIQQAKTIIWNGPVGVFEFDAFGEGTEALAQAIAHSQAFSLAGGGDTIAAIEKYGIAEQISYISTGGGAFLEYLEGRVLPSVEILEKRG